MSFFHLRLISSPDDFLLLSPLLPSEELGDYTCFEANIHWYFCRKCAVRCFAFAGESEVSEREIDGVKTKVWSAKKEGWIEGLSEGTGYLSVNAATLDADQEGLDLREWTEKGWIAYLDIKNSLGEDRLVAPHPGGMY